VTTQWKQQYGSEEYANVHNELGAEAHFANNKFVGAVQHESVLRPLTVCTKPGNDHPDLRIVGYVKAVTSDRRLTLCHVAYFVAERALEGAANKNGPDHALLKGFASVTSLRSFVAAELKEFFLSQPIPTEMRKTDVAEYCTQAITATQRAPFYFARAIHMAGKQTLGPIPKWMHKNKVGVAHCRVTLDWLYSRCDDDTLLRSTSLDLFRQMCGVSVKTDSPSGFNINEDVAKQLDDLFAARFGLFVKALRPLRTKLTALRKAIDKALASRVPVPGSPSQVPSTGMSFVLHDDKFKYPPNHLRYWKCGAAADHEQQDMPVNIPQQTQEGDDDGNGNTNIPEAHEELSTDDLLLFFGCLLINKWMMECEKKGMFRFGGGGRSPPTNDGHTRGCSRNRPSQEAGPNNEGTHLWRKVKNWDFHPMTQDWVCPLPLPSPSKPAFFQITPSIVFCSKFGEALVARGLYTKEEVYDELPMRHW